LQRLLRLVQLSILGMSLFRLPSSSYHVLAFRRGLRNSCAVRDQRRKNPSQSGPESEAGISGIGIPEWVKLTGRLTLPVPAHSFPSGRTRVIVLRTPIAPVAGGCRPPALQVIARPGSSPDPARICTRRSTAGAPSPPRL